MENYSVHITYMAKDHVRIFPKRQRLPNYIKQWRKSKNLSQTRLGERIGVSHATISRVERGEQDYTQTMLELIAEEIGTDPVSLLIRDPSDPDNMWSVWDQARKAEPSKRRMISDLALTVLKTGT